MAKLTPLHDRILIRRVEEAETTRGGIIIPDSAKDKPQEGEVIAVGKGKSNDEGKVFPLAVKEGDRILFGKYAGTEIKIDGEDFIIAEAFRLTEVTKLPAWTGDRADQLSPPLRAAAVVFHGLAMEPPIGRRGFEGGAGFTDDDDAPALLPQLRIDAGGLKEIEQIL